MNRKTRRTKLVSDIKKATLNREGKTRAEARREARKNQTVYHCVSKKKENPGFNPMKK